MRRHTTSRGRFIHRENCVRGATRLKRSDLLKIFALKKKRRPARLVQSLAGQHRRAMNVRANALMRCANFTKVDYDRLTRRWHLSFGNALAAGRFRPGELEFGAELEIS